MTNEEAKNLIVKWLDSAESEGFLHLAKEYRQALDMAIKALEQESCEDEYIKVPKKALKYRTAGMVAYNAEWLKNHFDIERAVICVAQEPCEDAISRQAAIDAAIEGADDWDGGYNLTREEYIKKAINALPSVQIVRQRGHWIKGKYRDSDIRYNESSYKCSRCGEIIDFEKPTCPNCGADMREEQA